MDAATSGPRPDRAARTIGPWEVSVDATSGALRAVAVAGDAERTQVELTTAVELLVGGDERRAPTGGLEYPGAAWLGDAVAVADMRSGADPARELVSEQHVGDWRVRWIWSSCGERAPLLGLRLVVLPPATAPPLRDLRLIVRITLGDRGAWRLHAPGNMLRHDVELDVLPAVVDIAPAAGSRGSSAVVALSHDDGRHVVVWPLCRTEVGEIELSPEPDGIRLTYATGLAGHPSPDHGVEMAPLLLDLARRSWSDTSRVASTWFAELGITAPLSRPGWAAGATIFEAQLGYSVFRGEHRYEPYPTLADLRRDLDRIVDLGFDCIQLMPRQPYPSYNVHALHDVDVTFAPEAELRSFVDHCHELGVRVILDVLMHGVLDRESIRVAADAVREGPVFALLDRDPGDLFASMADPLPYQISWSRHILDFEPYWYDGSPERSPLLDEVPEWFYRDSSGGVTGIYTKAFDATHPGFRRAFVEHALDLVDRLGVDGFRFDAPTYNGFANWSPAARERASASQLGCVELFRQLRAALKARDPELLMYTEPSGIVHRESMDLNYNYDEQWLLGAVVHGDRRPAWSVRSGHDLVHWLRDRDAFLPAGSLTAHHVDSHDTFWWPTWGSKWRREQFGVDAVRALTSVFMTCGGPFMMFVGGELGIEDTLRDLTALKRRIPPLRNGHSHFEVLAPESTPVFSVVRTGADGSRAVVLVNLSDLAVTTPVAFPEAPGVWTDALGGGASSTTERLGRGEHLIAMAPWATRVFAAE